MTEYVSPGRPAGVVAVLDGSPADDMATIPTVGTVANRPKPVAGYAAEDWTGRIMPRMAKKAKLSAGDTEAVLAYVLAARGVEPEPSATR